MKSEASFVSEISDSVLQSEEQVNVSVFKEYEHIIIQSLITSFGLDIFIKDQHGGDVDTVHNIREIGRDPEMTYKRKSNETDYTSRGEYNYDSYHGDIRFANTKSEARRKAQETWNNEPTNDPHNRTDGIEDQYTGGKVSFANWLSPDRKAELDHVVECKAIHDDRGRVLAGLKGEDLANNPDNLAWTNKSLNASMGSWARHKDEEYRWTHNGQPIPMEEVSMKAYIDEHPDLDEETKRRMLKQYEKSKKAYEKQVNIAYYTSKKFFADTSKAALKTGYKMGLRQALGFVLSEIWFAVKEEFQKAKDSAESLLRAIGNGIKRGLENAKKRYKEIWHMFIEGSIAGLLSSLTTTLCNIFFTTAKNIVRIIRQSWASLVEATKIIIFNPDCLPFGERFRAGTKILATGASVVAGTMVSELISKTAIGTMPVVGGILQTFCGTLVSGIMSCTFLYVLDHNSAVGKIVEILNSVPTVDDIVRGYKEQGQLLEVYCARLMSIDNDKFRQEVADCYKVAGLLEAATNEEELSRNLATIYQMLNIESPFGNHEGIDSFMNDPTAVLKFQ